ncbi:hypothetical protein [Anaeromyxobacter oryzisoli]|uniref:hypothetical protein n=1 Tax=Anaeromyxobacter oryzisoli TaxID=2925408 RepID=UPI001F56DAC7|nr:hypothetical protein [Anaeromyxobacter sp. SG63]
MSASAAVVVDLESYRQARRARASAPAPTRPAMPGPASAPRVVPVLVWWVPVWPVA